jgi:uncharacterized protein (TIGR02391 family)
MTNDKLKMTFDPNVIDDLGAKLYSTLPPILAELIANGYDACATTIKIELKNGSKPSERQIIVSDNGHGMSYDEIQTQYLVVGRKKRDDATAEKTKCARCNREPIGKKGLGKLAFFGIAQTAQVRTIQDGKEVCFVMDLDAIHKSNGDYHPEFSVKDATDSDGTTITLSGIYRKTDFDLYAIKRSISNYFIFDKDFTVQIKNDTDTDFQVIDNEIRYEHSDRKPKYIWEFPETALRKELKQFSFSGGIRGKIILFDKPVRSSLRGVTLFSRRKLVNLPEFFPVQGSSYFFQYLTGWLEVDFIDDFTPDVISTNRSSLAWNDNHLAELKEFLEKIITFIHADWRKREQEGRKDSIKKKFNVDTNEWRESNKNNKTIRDSIDKLLPIIGDPEDIPETEIMKMFEIVHQLAPEHADFVLWTGLHDKITSNDFIRIKFFEGSYLEAAREAAQIYNEEVQSISGRTEDGSKLMEIAFGKEDNKLVALTNKSNDNEKNLEDGQKILSQGVMIGFKNPAVSHSSVTAGKALGLFTDRDCLDILSMISYLFSRLERRVSPK